VLCGHVVTFSNRYDAQTRQVAETSTDSNGRTTTRYRTETYTVKVTTFATSESIPYGRCEDRSPPVSCSTSVVKLDLSLAWASGDDATAEHIRMSRIMFDGRYRNRDTHYDSGMTAGVDGFEDKLLGLLSPDSQPWWMNGGLYLLCSIAGLSWPYRLIFDRACLHAAYTYSKIIYLQ